MFGSISDVSEILGKNFLGNEETTAKVFEYVGNRLTEHIERSNTRIKARTEDDYDEEESTAGNVFFNQVACTFFFSNCLNCSKQFFQGFRREI